MVPIRNPGMASGWVARGAAWNVPQLTSFLVLWHSPASCVWSTTLARLWPPLSSLRYSRAISDARTAPRCTRRPLHLALALQQQPVLRVHRAAHCAGTPADKILLMMTELIDGSLPSLTDIFCVQSAILECQNIYKPLHLKKQLMQSDELEVRAPLCMVCAGYKQYFMGGSAHLNVLAYRTTSALERQDMNQKNRLGTRALVVHQLPAGVLTAGGRVSGSDRPARG
jgi:hypothetical protein